MNAPHASPLSRSASLPPLLSLEGIEKRFGGVRALKGVSFDLHSGEVHALVGENGAGKSTLMKVLSGAHRPDGGRVLLEGREVVFSSPRQSQALGIGIIYQETSLYPDLSVLENLFMGRQPTRWGRIHWTRMEREARALLERLELDLPLRARLGDLGKARGQLVEIAKMVGREVGSLYPRHLRSAGKPLLEVRGLTRSSLLGTGVLEDVSFTVREGEIVGLAGLVGSGRTEVARALFGIDPFDSGTVTLEGKPVRRDPRGAVEQGLALLPEDRGRQGLVLPFSIRQNLSLPSLNFGGWLRPRQEDALSKEFIEKLDIRPPLASLSSSALSGGNQQKIVMGKWLATRPKLLILDEPTQGVDVGAKAEIHRTIDALVQEGLGILMISSELLEILGMADRILVMHRGRIAGELPRGSSQEDVMRLATLGRTPDEPISSRPPDSIPPGPNLPRPNLPGSNPPSSSEVKHVH